MFYSLIILGEMVLMVRKKKSKYSKDVSDKLVLVMLLAVVFVSLISLGIYLKALDHSKMQVQEIDAEDSPLSNEQNLNEKLLNQSHSETASTRGEVSLKIVQT